MSGRRAFITVATGRDRDGPVHVRCWEVPDDDAALDGLAGSLTEAFGEPAEWVSDVTGDDAGPPTVFYQGGGG